MSMGNSFCAAVAAKLAMFSVVIPDFNVMSRKPMMRACLKADALIGAKLAFEGIHKTASVGTGGSSMCKTPEFVGPFATLA